MARSALQWPPAMEHGTAVIQSLRPLLVTIRNNALSHAPTEEHAPNVLFRETTSEVMRPFPSGIFRQLLMYFRYLMPTRQLSMQHVMELTTSQHTTHSGCTCHL